MDFNYSYLINPETNKYLNIGLIKDLTIEQGKWYSYELQQNILKIESAFFSKNIAKEFIDVFGNNLLESYIPKMFASKIHTPIVKEYTKLNLLVPYNFINNDEFIFFEIYKILNSNIFHLEEYTINTFQINIEDLTFNFEFYYMKKVKEDELHLLICPKKEKIYTVELKNLLNNKSLSKNEFDSYNTALIKSMSDIFKECKSDTETDKLIYSLLNSGTMNDGSKLKIVTHFLNIEDQYQYYLNKKGLK